MSIQYALSYNPMLRRNSFIRFPASISAPSYCVLISFTTSFFLNRALAARCSQQNGSKTDSFSSIGYFTLMRSRFQNIAEKYSFNFATVFELESPAILAAAPDTCCSNVPFHPLIATYSLRAFILSLPSFPSNQYPHSSRTFRWNSESLHFSMMSLI